MRPEEISITQKISHTEGAPPQIQKEDSEGSPTSAAAGKLGQAMVDATKNSSPIPQPGTPGMTPSAASPDKEVTTGRTLLAAQNKKSATGIMDLPNDALKEIILRLDPKSQGAFGSCSRETRKIVNPLRETLEIGIKGYLPIALKRFPNINRINFASPPSLKDIQEITGLLEKVKYLDFSKCGYKFTDEVLRALLKKCPNLEHLDLRGCSNLTGSALTKMQAQCPNLVSLNLSHCRLINGVTLQNVLMNYPQLKFLNLTSCDLLKLTDTASYIKQLETLSLRNWNPRDENNINNVAPHCKNLINLDLSGAQFSNQTLETLLSNCSNLNSLNLDYWAKLPDETLNVLATHCKELTDLSLFACRKISVEALTELLKQCPKLKLPNLVGCTQLSEADITALKQLRQSLTMQNS